MSDNITVTPVVYNVTITENDTTVTIQYTTYNVTVADSNLQLIQKPWTPGIAFGGSSSGITYSTQSGNCYQVGNFYFCSFSLVLTNKGSATGIATLTGLPHAISGASDWGGRIVNCANMASLTTGIDLDAIVGGTIAQLNNIVSTGSAGLTNSNFTNTSTLMGFLIFAG